jgi:ornithine cyclodeaminase/alanine dehydrogenase-like protein (mu-crystallin family)
MKGIGETRGMLLLSNEDVAKVLSMAECIAILRRFFQQEAAGMVLTRHRTEAWLPRAESDSHYQFKTMEGGVPYLNRYVIRIDSNVTRETVKGQTSRMEHLPTVHGGWMGMLQVFDTNTGEFIGLMPDGYLQRTRVGALYSLAADYLARADAREVGLIGSGWQAGGQLLGLCSVRKIQRVRVYSPDSGNRERFAGEMARTLGIPVEPVADARSAVTGADIVALFTNAGQKVTEAAWAEPGQHINSVRFREMDPLLYQRADRVIVNRVEPWIRNYYVGEFVPREVSAVNVPDPPADRAAEARDLFARKVARKSDEEITLFPNEASNYQLGAQFAAVAGEVLARAQKMGLGRDLPMDWFAQTLHP